MAGPNLKLHDDDDDGLADLDLGAASTAKPADMDKKKKKKKAKKEKKEKKEKDQSKHKESDQSNKVRKEHEPDWDDAERREQAVAASLGLELRRSPRLSPRLVAKSPRLGAKSPNLTSKTKAPNPASRYDCAVDGVTLTDSVVDGSLPLVPPLLRSGFDQLALPAWLNAVFGKEGWKSPTPIQRFALPLANASPPRDLIAIAETGSGKTLAFLLPALLRLVGGTGFAVPDVAKVKKGVPSPRVLVMAPTRELAMQIQDVCQTLVSAAPGNLRSLCLYGGEPKGDQINRLRSAAASLGVVIATPGRLIDLCEGGFVNLSQVCYLVLDEADRMLDMGFEPQIRQVVKQLSPSGRQTLMFSATWPVVVRQLASEFLDSPVTIRVRRKTGIDGADAVAGLPGNALVSNSSVHQSVIVCEEFAKWKTMINYLNEWTNTKRAKPFPKILIFMLYKKSCDRLWRQMQTQGWPVGCLHGDKSQAAREQAMAQFRTGEVPILVATDVAARGLDVPDVRYVLNYEFPLLCEDYVHRVGRTGRAGLKGIAVTLFSPQQDKQHARELRELLKRAGQEANINAEFNALAEKAPMTAVRGRTKRERENGIVDDGRPMPKATKITFGGDDDASDN